MTHLRLLFKRTARRRMAAFLAAMFVVGAQVEITLPESHDGDERVGHVAHEGRHEEPSRAPTDTGGSHPTHAVHVDHCAHGHVFASGAEPVIATTTVAESDKPVTPIPLLSSVASQPHSRPPIA